MTDKNTPGSKPPSDSEAKLLAMQRIARYALMEPADGLSQIATIRNVRNKVEKQLVRAREIGKGLHARFQSSPANQALKTALLKSKETLLRPSEKGNPLLLQLQTTYGDLSMIIKNGIEHAGKWSSKTALKYFEKSLEYLLYQDAEAWVAKRAGAILHNDASLESIRKISHEERKLLIETLYPYDSPELTKYFAMLDTSINYGLGLIVASNLPFTGLSVSLINMTKTILKIAQRLHILSAIHGRQIVDPNALFLVCAAIIRSLQERDSNPEIPPLPLETLDPLYRKGGADRGKGFSALLDATLKKEAYIAIPGVGTIALGKIALDDYRMDRFLRFFVENYFNREELRHSFPEELEEGLPIFTEINAAFLKHEFFAHMTALLKRARKDRPAYLNVLLHLPEHRILFESLSDFLDRFCIDLYREVHGLPARERAERIETGVKTVLDGEESGA